MKKSIEVEEFRSIGVVELQEKVASFKEELMNLRFRHAAGQLEHTAQLGLLRKKIARASTAISEKRIAAEENVGN